MSYFNVNDGFAEAVVRGYRSAFLSQEDYRRLSAADNLEGMSTQINPRFKVNQISERPWMRPTMLLSCKMNRVRYSHLLS